MSEWKKHYEGARLAGCNPVEVGVAAQDEIDRLRDVLAYISNFASGYASPECEHIYKTARDTLGVPAPFYGK